MKYLVVLLLVSTSFSDFCDQEIVHSKIINENNEGIPFASIGIIKRNYGAVTFEDGTFSLIANRLFLEDSLVVSAVGYERRKISYSDFVTKQPERIMLKEDVQVLDEITISPDRLSYSKLGVSKSKSFNNYGLSSPLDGATIAMRFDGSDEPLLIDEVAVTIGKINMDEVQLRCRIFEMDSETSLPGIDLLRNNLLATSVEKQERLVFQLEEELYIEGPFFVGFEWVMTKSQFKKLEEASNEFNLDFIDKIVAKNPGYSTYNVNENKRILFRDSENKLINKVPLTKAQTAILDEKDAQSPKLQFKIKMKGTNTYSGSPITGKWYRIPHEALVSVRVGSTK